MEPIEFIVGGIIAGMAMIIALGMSFLVMMIVLAPIIGLYFLPSIIAFFRKTERRWWIFGTNAIFGGTGIGWFGSLIWAILDKPQIEEVI